MARFMADFVVNRADADQFIQFVAQDFFQKEGFKYVNFKGEQVWKKGTGALVAPQFMKLEYRNGQVHIEAWIRAVWLPGVYGKEMDFSGAYGFAIKEHYKTKVNTLINLLLQPQFVAQGAQPPQNEWAQQQATNPQGAQQMGAAQQGTQQQAMPPQIPVVVHNTHGSAVLALVMGLVSIIGILVPLVGVICGIIGIGSGVKGRNSTSPGMAIAGLVLSIIFLIVSIFMWVLSAVMIASYF